MVDEVVISPTGLRVVIKSDMDTDSVVIETAGVFTNPVLQSVIRLNPTQQKFVLKRNRQARREPQRSLETILVGPYQAITTFVCAEIETPKGSRERKHGEGCSLAIRVGAWGSVVRFPAGVRGRVPAKNLFYAYLRSKGAI